ncbi:MAG: hypothetical protein V4598_13670 [Bdellovibrionota bacterium]
MKFVLATSLLAMSFSLLANTNPQECLKKTKALDRRYCLDSYLETIRDTLGTERQAMANGLPEATKTAKVTATEQEINAKKDYMNAIKTEIELQEKYLEEVKAAKVATTAAPVPKKEKKKKKDKGFRIKL